MSRYYFAYGANLNVEGMRFRCPQARPVARIELNNYQLVFRGVADLISKKGSKATGVIWNITKECEKSLDRFEGYPFLYGKKFFEVELNGKVEEVMFYYMLKRDFDFPNKPYYETIKGGYVDFCLDLDFLDNALLYTDKLVSQRI